MTGDSSEADYTPAEPAPDTALRVTVATVIGFTTLGIIGGILMESSSVVVTWYWMGIGLAALFLLYRVQAALVHLAQLT